MNYFKEEKEISIKELMYSVCSRWRSIIALVFLSVIATLIVNIPSAAQYKDILGTVVLVKALVKQAIIIGVVIGVLMVGIYVFKFLFTDTIKSVNEFSLTCNINIIGSIVNEKAKKVGKIDAFLKKLNGIKLRKKNAEKYIEHVAKVIENSIKVQNDEKVRIAVISSYSDEVTDEAVEAIKVKISSEIELISAGDVTVSAFAVTQVMDSDYIVLAEYRGKSKYYEIEQTVEKIKELNKDILGVVVLNADAI